MTKQQEMTFDDPDNCQEQRRLLQAWLKIIKRKLPAELKRQIGFVNWAIKTSRSELTPANYAYFRPIAQEALHSILKKYERHIKAERNILEGL